MITISTLAKPLRKRNGAHVVKCGTRIMLAVGDTTKAYYFFFFSGSFGISFFWYFPPAFLCAGCASGPSEAVRYMMSASIFPFGVALLSVSYGVSLGCPRRRRWQGPKMLSTAGAFLQVGYSTMSATALAPLMCYKHPIGLRSVLQYPGVVCGTAEHSVMLTMSILLLVFVLGFLALCFWAALKVTRQIGNSEE